MTLVLLSYWRDGQCVWDGGPSDGVSLVPEGTRLPYPRVCWVGHALLHICTNVLRSDVDMSLPYLIPYELLQPHHSQHSRTKICCLHVRFSESKFFVPLSSDDQSHRENPNTSRFHLRYPSNAKAKDIHAEYGQEAETSSIPALP